MLEPSQRSGSARAYLLAGIPILITLLAFWGALGQERGLFYRDHTLFFRPEWWSIYSQLREGLLPVLNLAHPSGQPHEFSTNYALFTPLTLILLLGPFAHTYDLFVVSHFAVLALGAYLLLRELDVEATPALIGSTAAALAGPIVSFESLLVGLSGIAFAPWIWWALLRLLRAPSQGNVAALALCAAFGVQGIMPEVLLLHGLVTSGLAWHVRPRPAPRLGLALVAAGALAFLVAAVDIIPQLDALSGSRRWAGFDRSELEGWTFGSYQLVELIAPAFWASPNLYFFNVPVATGSAVDPPYLPTLYLGVVLPLALAAPLRTDRRAQIAALLAFVFLLIAAGPATPLHRIITSLPILRSSRFAVKYVVLAVPMVAALAVLSSSALARGLRWKTLLAVSGVHSALLAGIIVWSRSPDTAAWLGDVAQPFQGAIPFEVYQDDVVGMALRAMQSSASHAALAAVSLCLCAFLGAARPTWRRGLSMAILILVAMDLGLAVPFGAPLGSAEATRLPEPLVSALGKTRPIVMVGAPRPVPHIDGQTCFEDHLLNHGRHGLLGWENYRILDTHDLEGLAGNPVQPMVLAWFEGLPRAESEALLTRAHVGYYIGASGELGREMLRFHDHVGRELILAELPASRRAHASLHASWVELSITSSAARQAFVDPRGVERPVIWSSDGSTHDDTECRPQMEKIAAAHAETFRFRTSSACPAVLVLREFWYPRWRATLDGEPVETLLAEAGFIGVRVPTGGHVVELTYDSLTRKWMWISIGSALLCLALLISGSVRLERAKTEAAHQAPGVHSKN